MIPSVMSKLWDVLRVAGAGAVFSVVVVFVVVVVPLAAVRLVALGGIVEVGDGGG